MADLDDMLIDLLAPKVNTTHADYGLRMLVKMAEEGAPGTTAISAAPAEVAGPNPELPIMLMGRLVALKFAKQIAYAMYDALVGNLMGYGYTEEQHAKTFLRRLQNLRPDGFVVPSPPPVVPTAHRPTAIKTMINFEQQALSLLQQLHGLCAQDPFSFAVEQMMGDCSKHIDKLNIELQQEAPSAPVMPTIAATKVARAASMIKKREAMPKQANEMTPEEFAASERDMLIQQAATELAHTKAQLQQTAAQAQQAQQAQQMAQQQVEEMSTQMQHAMQMSQAHQQQAIEAEGRAADHASQKLQLGMKIQQMRQAMAQMVATDPVAELGGNTNDLAAQGAPATPSDIQEAEQESAEQQAPPATAKQVQEVEQAQRAQSEAEEQTAQAEQAVQKTSGFAGDQVKNVIEAVRYTAKKGPALSSKARQQAKFIIDHPSSLRIQRKNTRLAEAAQKAYERAAPRY